MGKTSRSKDEQRLIELLIDHDQKIVKGDSCHAEQSDNVTSGQHRIQLAKAKKCLEQLQQFAQRKSFPGDPAKPDPVAERDTPVDDPNGSTVKQRCENIGEFKIPESDDFASSHPVFSCAFSAASKLPENIGRFRILRQLGIGGFGIVFHAHDPQLNRDVALKILRPESLLTAANRVRFERESQLAALLSHPAIVPVYETGIDGPIRYIVFGYIAGENLADWRARFEQPLNPQSATELMLRVADAVACAHSQGILHRDLKPSNLLVHAENPKHFVTEKELADRIHVADFGLAIDIDVSSSLTRSGTMIGTPVYIAPELITGSGKPSMASDVYSLGVILFELLAGRPPFCTDSGLQLLRTIVEDSPPRINPIRIEKQESSPNRQFPLPNVHRDLEAICFKCLQKNPDQRYQSASELKQDLQRWQAGESVSARPVTAVSQIWRWMQRKPLIAGLLATVSFLVLALAFGGTWVAIELSHKNADLKDSYFRSLLTRSQLTRRSATAGRRINALQVIRSASDLLSNSPADQDRRLQLRNEAIASMCLDDLEVVSRIPLPTGIKPTPSGLDMAFDSSLEKFALSNDDGELVVLDTLTAKVLNTVSMAGQVRQALFVPGADEVCVVQQTKESADFLVASLDDRIADQVRTFSISDIDIGFRIDCSIDGRLVVGSDNSGRLQLIDLKSGEKKSELTFYSRLNSKQGPPAGACFSPSGKQLAVWSGNRTDVFGVVDDLVSNEPTFTFEHRFNTGLVINSVAWSPDEEQLATTTSVFTTHLWSTVWGESRHQELAGHTGWVYHAVFDPQGQFIVTSSADGTSRMWNCQTGELMLVIDGLVTAISVDGTRLAGVKSDEIAVWKILGTSYQQHWTWENCNDKCRIASFGSHSNADGRVLSICNSTEMLIRDIETQQVKWIVETDGGRDLVFSGDGKFGLAVYGNRIMRIDTETGKEQLMVERQDPANDCWCILHKSLSASCDGTRLVFATSDRQALVNCESGEIRWLSSRFADMGYPRFHPSLPRYALATEQGIEIWDYESDKLLSLVPGATLRHPVGFNRTGEYLVLHENGRLALLNLATGNIGYVADDAVLLDRDDVAFSPDGQTMAVCGIENNIILYRLPGDSGDEVEEIARFPVATAQTWVAFSHSSDSLISADADQGIYHWNLVGVRRELAELGLDWND